jgi:orotate phosphoribosyltransferase
LIQRAHTIRAHAFDNVRMTSSPASDASIAREFVQFAVDAGVLRFGEYKTKAGRLSPYFFNSGLFDDGAKLMRLGEFYARRLLASRLEFDMLFGPAYKGITLAAAVAIELGRRGRAVPFAFNRKEAKDHGEGGLVVGAPLRGRAVIVDDVITDGASKRESVELLRRQGAEPVAVLIALDRMERGGAGDNLSERSAVEEFERDYAMPVISVATVGDLLAFLRSNADPALAAHAAAVASYRRRYGV